MKIDIENIAEEKGRNIANIIFEKYGEYPIVEHKSFWGGFLDGILRGGYSRLKVEKDIYERSLHEATAFFLNQSEAKFDDKIIETLKFRLETRLRNPKEVKKLKPEEMLANLVKIYAVDFLLKKGLII